MELVRQLQEYRFENKLSLQKLAKILNVSYVTIGRWERGESSPNKIQTYHIKKFLNEKNKRKINANSS